MLTARQILHIDMDAFYASVEQLDKPELKGKAVLVGGSVKERGVVAACSYEARKFGIHSAMPMSQAIRLCPRAVVLPVRMGRYVELSGQIHKIFYEYSPEIEPISLDEAFIDITGSLKLFGSAEKIGREIKDRIKNELGLTASVGIAPNKFLAKLASDLEKPNGFVIITEENKQQIIDPLNVSRIWGIGKVTTKALGSMGVTTIKQLRSASVSFLNSIFGNQTEEIQQLARGIDDREVVSDRQAKSISQEETFPEDIIDKDVLTITLHNQIEQVAQRLRAQKLQGKTITLKLRYGNFKTITRSCGLEAPTNITAILLEEGEELFMQWYGKSATKLRLLGFGVSGLSQEGSGQKLLFS
ncbi:MAG TPA: DNA polymerase IV, partial [Sedimentisphaerales bacterium]|nr:DNA polymerase IV [Sedimentisphaerales bacterium]